MSTRNMRLTSPLNPDLLTALRSAYGSVGIIRAGQKRLPPRTRSDGSRTGWQWGEEYAIDCPFCGDTTRQMVLSYEYGVHTSNIQDGYNLHLVRCFADDCHENKANLYSLWGNLQRHGYKRRMPRHLASMR